MRYIVLALLCFSIIGCPRQHVTSKTSIVHHDPGPMIDVIGTYDMVLVTDKNRVLGKDTLVIQKEGKFKQTFSSGTGTSWTNTGKWTASPDLLSARIHLYYYRSPVDISDQNKLTRDRLLMDFDTVVEIQDGKTTIDIYKDTGRVYIKR